MRLITMNDRADRTILAERSRPRIAIGLLRLGSVLMLAATAMAAGTPPVAEPLSLPAKQWAREAAENELKVIQYKGNFLRYRIHSTDAKGDQTRDMIETRDGTVARLIMKEGRPLTRDEDDAERSRLQAMIDSPATFAKHVKGDSAGKKMGADMIRLMPDAMLFAYAPGQPQRSTRAANPDEPAEVVIDYKPDPAWTPPNMTADVLTGLQGRLWIDSRTHYLTRMEGNVFRAVNFGLGFFAHVYPGGRLTFEQVHATDQRWIFSHFVQHVTVRALLVKTFREDAEMQGSNYVAVPEMSYQEAIKVLTATPLPTR